MIKIKIYIIFSIISFSFSQGPWIMTGQVHNELSWNTLTTEHYRVHYHQGVEEIAGLGAAPGAATGSFPVNSLALWDALGSRSP